jgi:hypothetical protein
MSAIVPPATTPAVSAVVIEVRSKPCRLGEWEQRFEQYEADGVEEYYVIYPEWPMSVEGWCRRNGRLASIPDMTGWVSPRLGIKWVSEQGNLFVYGSGSIHSKAAGSDPVAWSEALQLAKKLAVKLRELGVDPDAV